jgi:hypothetical protein
MEAPPGERHKLASIHHAVGEVIDPSIFRDYNHSHKVANSPNVEATSQAPVARGIGWLTSVSFNNLLQYFGRSFLPRRFLANFVGIQTLQMP